MEIFDFIINSDSVILDALQVIDKNSEGIVYICKDKQLLGTVTDGDVRRHIMNAGSIYDKVTDIMNKTPLYCTLENKMQAQYFMKNNSIRSVPIVDHNKYIVDIVFLNKKKSVKKCRLDVPVVIMAGGKGTRLYPYTKILPKPLIPIGEKTITEHIMNHFEEYGCHHFNMIVNYKKHFIKSYFLDNENPIDVEFTDENTFLGTGGGLKLLQGKYKETFFMTNCDILVEEDYNKIFNYHKTKNNMITMVCAKKNMVIPYGTVDVSDRGEALKINEKPEFSFITNTGFYVIEPEFLEMIPDNTFIHITDVIQKCIDEGKKVGVYEIDEEKWLDMGQMEEMERMRQNLEIR